MHTRTPRPTHRIRRTAVAAATATTLILSASVAADARSTPTERYGRVAGLLVNSAGQVLPHIRVIVDGHTPSGRSFRFHARTNAYGRFRLGSAAGTVNAIRWTAEARLPWYGGVWLRDLNTLSNSPGRLVFRADVVDRGGDSIATGVFVDFHDFDGCNTVSPSDPDYVASDPDTQSITLTFQPAQSRLVDGTTAVGGSVTVGSLSLCDTEGAEIHAPAGAWVVTGVTDTGRALAFSTTLGEGPYVTPAVVFDYPMAHGDHPAQLDVHFAS